MGQLPRIFILSFLLWPVVAGADIYRYEDRDGVVHYSNTQPDIDAVDQPHSNSDTFGYPNPYQNQYTFSNRYPLAVRYTDKQSNALKVNFSSLY